MNEQMMELASREILWNIPPVLKVFMYMAMLVALSALSYGLWLRYSFVMGDKKNRFFPEKLEWLNFFKALMFQGKIIRKPVVAMAHALMFWGFMTLWVATDLVAIHYDTPFKVFQGTTYIVISFLADIAGILLLIGVLYFFYRRFIQKPKHLERSKVSYGEIYMYGMLALLVIGGFVIEGMRISGNNMPINEKSWSPIGWLIANFFQVLNLSDATMGWSYRIIWTIHMLMTMFFVASFGYSKFFHVMALPLSALVTPKMRSAVLNPMNFENEEAETFGLSKVSELTPKQRFDLISCVECGRCTEVCPANNASKPLDPRQIITKMRDFSIQSVGGPLKLNKTSEGTFWEADSGKGIDLYSASELDSCTTCGACVEECPANIEHITTIMDLKRYKALTKGEIPEAAAVTINKIKNSGNPWGLPQEKRFDWATGLDIPVIESGGTRYDYLYFVGCAGSYDPANQKVVKDTLALLKEAKVSFAVMGKKEKCTGDAVRRFGDEYTFIEIAMENIELLKSFNFGKIVTHCPHCLHTIGKEYKKFTGGEFEVVHHTELLDELVRVGKLKPKKSVAKELTFHDPCYLGRHHGEYNAPRNILNAVPGIQLKEMEKSKEKSRCCGMGGGNMWYELPEGEHLSKKRLEDIGKMEVSTVATSCSFCMINLQSSKKQVKETSNVAFEDVASILHQSVFENETLNGK